MAIPDRRVAEAQLEEAEAEAHFEAEARRQAEAPRQAEAEYVKARDKYLAELPGLELDDALRRHEQISERLEDLPDGYDPQELDHLYNVCIRRIDELSRQFRAALPKLDPNAPDVERRYKQLLENCSFTVREELMRARELAEYRRVAEAEAEARRSKAEAELTRAASVCVQEDEWITAQVAEDSEVNNRKAEAEKAWQDWRIALTTWRDADYDEYDQQAADGRMLLQGRAEQAESVYFQARHSWRNLSLARAAEKDPVEFYWRIGSSLPLAVEDIGSLDLDTLNARKLPKGRTSINCREILEQKGDLEAFENVLRHLWEPEAGAFIFGATGLGKTRAARALASLCTVLDYYPVGFVRESQLSEMVDRASKYLKVGELLKGVSRYEIMVIDDLGHKMNAAMGRFILDLLDTDVCLVITSQFRVDELPIKERKTREAIVRRIKEFCKAFHFAEDEEA